MPEKVTSSSLDTLVSAASLARAIGVTARQLRDVLDRAACDRVRGHGYRLDSVLRVLYQRRVEQDATSSTLVADEARLAKARADRYELELAIRRRDLVSANAAAAVVADILAHAGRPRGARIAGLIATCHSQADVARVIDRDAREQHARLVGRVTRMLDYAERAWRKRAKDGDREAAAALAALEGEKHGTEETP